MILADKYAIVFRSWAFSSSGYGQEVRAYIKGFVTRGMRTSFSSFDWRFSGYPVFLVHEEPDIMNVETITQEDNALLRSLLIPDIDKFKKEQHAKKSIIYVSLLYFFYSGKELSLLSITRFRITSSLLIGRIIILGEQCGKCISKLHCIVYLVIDFSKMISQHNGRLF